jgi:urocanate hydratase
MVLDGSKESKRLASMLSGMSTTDFKLKKKRRRTICHQRAEETQPLLKVTIPNIVADNLLIFKI